MDFARWRLTAPQSMSLTPDQALMLRCSRENIDVTPSERPSAMAMKQDQSVSSGLTARREEGTRGYRRRDPNESSVPEFLRGAVASFANILLTFPANKLMFRQQVEGWSAKNAFHSMRVEGLSHLYRGVGPPLLQRTLTMSMMFGLYDLYHKKLQRVDGLEDQPMLTAVVASMLAGSSEGLLCPLERVQTLLQHRHYTEHYENMIDAARKLSRHGLREYYRGFTAVVLRNGPSSAMFFSLREPLQMAWPAPEVPFGLGAIGRNFLSGALLGACISTIFFPLNVAKSVMQSQVGGRFPGVSVTLRRLVEERGIRGLFRGVHVNYTRSLVSWGIINSVYELLRPPTA